MAFHKGYRLVLYLGNNPDDTDQYLLAPVELGPSERRFIYTLTPSSSIVANASIKTLLNDNSESSWRTIAAGVVLDPVTINLGSGVYNIGFVLTGKPAAGQTILTFQAKNAFTVHATAHTGTCTVHPTATADFPCYKNGTLFGTLRLSTAGVLSLVAFSATAFAVGDILTVVAPASQDATLSTPSFVLIGNV
jgi:hypothetical protein